jgi:hypothetical protein
MHWLGSPVLGYHYFYTNKLIRRKFLLNELSQAIEVPTI